MGMLDRVALWLLHDASAFGNAPGRAELGIVVLRLFHVATTCSWPPLCAAGVLALGQTILGESSKIVKLQLSYFFGFTCICSIPLLEVIGDLARAAPRAVKYSYLK